MVRNRSMLKKVIDMEFQGLSYFVVIASDRRECGNLVFGIVLGRCPHLPISV